MTAGRDISDGAEASQMPLGATFVRRSTHLLDESGRRLAEGKVAEGLALLSPDMLQEALQYGIVQSARRASVGLQFVEGLMPLGELLALGEKLKMSHRSAVIAWEQHPGSASAAPGGAPDPTRQLERLSEANERPIAQPLDVLAKDVGRWQSLLGICAERLDQGGLLERARRQRRLRKLGTVVALVLIALSAGAIGVDAWLTRRRVASALEANDPCAVQSVTPLDLLKIGGSQRAGVERRQAECTDLRAREERAREEQRATDERARESERARKQREDRCDALAAHVDAGALAPEDERLAGPAAALLGRVATRTLQPTDAGPADPVLGCDDTPAAAKLLAAWGRAVMAAPRIWANAEEPSAKLQAVLVERKAELPEDAKYVLLARADESARQALEIGGPIRLSRAVRLCTLKTALDLPEGLACSSLLAIAREKGELGR